MRKKVKIICGCSIFLVCIMVCFSCFFVFIEPVPDGAYIFSDISECQKLNKNNETSNKTDISPEDDSNLDVLKYNLSYTAKQKSTECNYKIYAYVFEDNTMAERYFEKCTKRVCSGEKDFYFYSNFVNYNIYVKDGNRVYSLYTFYIYRETIDELLKDAFSVYIDRDDLLEQPK